MAGEEVVKAVVILGCLVIGLFIWGSILDRLESFGRRVYIKARDYLNKEECK